MRPRGATRIATALLVLIAVLGTSLVETTERRGMAQDRGLDLDPDQIVQTLRLVADWQMHHPAEYPLRDWTMAPLYDGLIDVSLVTGDPAYLAAVIHAGKQVHYAPGNELADADSQAVGHAWLRISLMDPQREPEVLARFVEHFDAILANEPIGVGWTWADALHMAPPTMVRLAQASGDDRYLDLAYTEFAATHAALFDPEEHLFYRDARFIDQLTPNGEKVFWGRGDGWVYAGLAKVLAGLPADHPSYTFYRDLFLEMSPAILAAQQPDGLWYPSLLDPAQIPIGETSASALILFGMAWGVNQGILDRETYLPAVERAWKALLTRIRPDGEVDFVQPIGDQPRSFDPGNSASYGTGAVLEAGAEILRLLNAATVVDPTQLRDEAETLADLAPDLSTARP